jgi:hypothetical protein
MILREVAELYLHFMWSGQKNNAIYQTTFTVVSSPILNMINFDDTYLSNCVL